MQFEILPLSCWFRFVLVYGSLSCCGCRFCHKLQWTLTRCSSSVDSFWGLNLTFICKLTKFSFEYFEKLLRHQTFVEINFKNQCCWLKVIKNNNKFYFWALLIHCNFCYRSTHFWSRYKFSNSTNLASSVNARQ